MRRLVVLAIFLAAVLPVARAQESADEQYLIIYGIMEQADADGNSGNVHQALDSFTEAQTDLEQFQKLYPDWNPNIVQFRLNYIAEKISELTPRLPVTNAPPAVVSGGSPPAAAANANLESQISQLQQQVQGLQANNTALEAKLKEALSVQPAAIDPRELDKARDQIRELMKENDLLKVTLNQGNATAAAPKVDTNALAELQQSLALTQQKLRAEVERADRMAQEDETLQARMKELLTGPDALAALREENELLKKQLAGFEAAARNPAAADVQAELDSARAQIVVLQSNAVVAAQENLSLQDRINQLQSGKAPAGEAEKLAADEASIRDLTQERDDLLAKLGEANSRLYKKSKGDAVARINDLADEVSTLRARLAVDEAQPVPYSDDELAMLREPAPAQADPDTEEKSIKEMPAGSAQLVAEAQSYFAAQQYDKAAADYQKILEHDQNNGIALGNLATIELQEGKLDDAEKHIRAALAEAPHDAYNLSILGYVKFQQGKYDDALDALSQAAKLDPNNPEIQNYLGVTLSHKGLRLQAETALRRAIELQPNYAAAHNNLAVVYISEDPPLAQLARWHYQKALDDGQARNPELESVLAAKGVPVNP